MNTAKFENRQYVRCGFTLLELLIVISLIGIIVGMLLPAVRSVREPARRTACANNLRQLALASLNFESAHGHFPAAMGFVDPSLNPSDEGAARMSGLIALLPYIEQGELWNTISNPQVIDDVSYPAFPAPWISEYSPWKTQIEGFLCPSGMYDDELNSGQKSYVFCIGDQARQIHTAKILRGAYGCAGWSTLANIQDGCSNTIAFSEVGNSWKPRQAKCEFAINQPEAMLDKPVKCLELLDSSASGELREEIATSSERRGSRWADGAAGFGMFNTILPPNSPSIAVGSDAASDGIYSAASFHSGGINAARCDGSITFVRDNIDTGDLSQPVITTEQFSDPDNLTPSPYGVWGALGTASGEEPSGY